MKELKLYFEDKLIDTITINGQISICCFEDKTLIYDDKKEVATVPNNYLIITKEL